MRRGFTLVEMLVVLFLLSLISLLAVPRWVNLSDLTLSFAMDQLVADLYLTRELSFCHGTAYLSYANGPNGAYYYISDQGKIVKRAQLAKELYFPADGNLIFWGAGFPVTGYSIDLAAKGAKYRGVIVIALSTGRIRSNLSY
ncbi:MAG: prepilin-type N-terminal cleavage/methylation domain-containing protein [Sporomusaceae bacterium]|nr:prepilin-type N-terminal cleavage/methylation domain-containing protein [Sporomusaceae bacterium]